MAKKFLTSLDLDNNELINGRLENLATDPAFGNAGRVYYNTATGKARLDTGGAIVDLGNVGDMEKSLYDTNGDGTVDNAAAVPWTGVTGKPATFTPSAHTHLSSEITDFVTAVNTQVAAYWDSIAGTDANVDTIREVLDMVLANASTLQSQIGRFNADIGDGTATSIGVTHSLNSLDVTVEVYEKATGASVQVDVVRTTADVVTITTAVPMALNAYRVVIKK